MLQVATYHRMHIFPRQSSVHGTYPRHSYTVYPQAAVVFRELSQATINPFHFGWISPIVFDGEI
jgi:hypothetical protein